MLESLKEEPSKEEQHQQLIQSQELKALGQELVEPMLLQELEDMLLIQDIQHLHMSQTNMSLSQSQLPNMLLEELDM